MVECTETDGSLHASRCALTTPTVEDDSSRRNCDPLDSSHQPASIGPAYAAARHTPYRWHRVEHGEWGAVDRVRSRVTQEPRARHEDTGRIRARQHYEW